MDRYLLCFENQSAEMTRLKEQKQSQIVANTLKTIARISMHLLELQTTIKSIKSWAATRLTLASSSVSMLFKLGRTATSISSSYGIKCKI